MHTIFNQLIMLTISLRFQRTFQQNNFVQWCMYGYCSHYLTWNYATTENNSDLTVGCALIKIVMFQWKLDHKVDLSPASTVAVGLQSFFHCHLSWKVFANLTDTAQTHSGLIVVIIFIFYPLIIITLIIIISVKQQCSQAIILCVDRYFIWHQVEGSLNKISKPE